jgi:hypothetical protein
MNKFNTPPASLLSHKQSEQVEKELLETVSGIAVPVGDEVLKALRDVLVETMVRPPSPKHTRKRRHGNFEPPDIVA